MYAPGPADDRDADLLFPFFARDGYAVSQYAATSASIPMNTTWPGMGMSMAQGAWLYPPETLSNEFSVLS